MFFLDWRGCFQFWNLHMFILYIKLFYFNQNLLFLKGPFTFKDSDISYNLKMQICQTYKVCKFDPRRVALNLSCVLDLVL